MRKHLYIFFKKNMKLAFTLYSSDYKYCSTNMFFNDYATLFITLIIIIYYKPHDTVMLFSTVLPDCMPLNSM